MNKTKKILNKIGIAFFSLVFITMLASIAFGSTGLKSAPTPQDFEKWYSDATWDQIGVLTAIESNLSEAYDTKATIELALQKVNTQITSLEQSRDMSIDVLAQLKYTDVSKSPVNEEDKQRELDRLNEVLNGGFQ